MISFEFIAQTRRVLSPYHTLGILHCTRFQSSRVRLSDHNVSTVGVRRIRRPNYNPSHSFSATTGISVSIYARLSRTLDLKIGGSCKVFFTPSLDSLPCRQALASVVVAFYCQHRRGTLPH